MESNRNLRSFGTLLIAAVLGSALTFGAVRLIEKKAPVIQVAHSSGAPTVQTKYGQPGGAGPDFTMAAEKAMPTVVHIKSTTARTAPQSQRALPDPFRDFFGDGFSPFQPGPQGPQVGSGSGVIITADGYIVTNNHVVEGADDLEVSLNDNRTYKAEVVGLDPSTDLALIKVDADNLVPATFANSDDVRVGEWVLAIGNPFNLNSTVTAGIVSAKARNINILRDQSAIESFIQTDAAVNPGNSGGGLMNLNGELIGVNTAIASPTGAFAGYSFAVPANIVRKVVEDLMQFGVVQRGFLGVIIRSVDGNLAREKGLSVTEGVYVDSLAAGSSAAAAGIKKGDVILKVDGRQVHNSSELQAAIGTRRPGDKVLVTIQRNDKPQDISVVLKNRSGNTDVVKRDKTNVLELLGVELEALSREDLKKFGLENGVRIKKINAGKLRTETDVREGFIITSMAGKAVGSPEEVAAALENRSGGVMMEGIYPDYPRRSFYYAFGM